MKPFDKAAAMRGARVCTREGYTADILSFHITDKYKHICAVIHISSANIDHINQYTDQGEFMLDGRSHYYDLVMADDDYMEKLDRGEYGTPSPSPVPDPAPAPDPWDEFKRQAAIAMIQTAGGGVISSSDIEQILRSVNALVDGLKKM